MSGKLLPIALLILLAGCASTPDLFPEGLRQPSPQQLAGAPRSVPQGQRMTWGGVIVEVSNLPDRTVLEVLAYPLNRSGRPDTDATPMGRFLADREGFLEPRDYAPGREVTVSGPLLGYRDGKVGDAAYRFPALAVQQLQLWQRRGAGSGGSPRVGVGLGVSNHGGGVGFGVGF